MKRPIQSWRTARDTDEERLQRLFPFLKFIVATVILLLSLVSGAMTFEGIYLLNLRVGGQSFATVAYAGLLSIGITAGIMAAWWVMLAILPTLHGRRRIVSGLVLVMALQGWMLSVSTTNNVTALAGNEALVTHMEKTQVTYEQAVSASVARALQVKPFLGLMQGEADGRCRQAEGERNNGSFTGSPGAGAVSGILDLLCVQSTTTVDTLRASVEYSEDRADEAARILQAMDAAIWNFDKSVFEREREFLTQLGELKTWLRLASANDLSQTLESAHGIMAEAVTPPSLASGSFGERQSALIADLRTGVERTGERYQEIAAKIASEPLPDLSDTVRISLVRAVWRARTDLIPSLAAAIGLDFFQIFMALAFLVGRPQTAR